MGNNTSRTYVEVCLGPFPVSSGEAEIMSTVLARYGIPREQVVELVTGGLMSLLFYVEDMREAQQIKSRIISLSLPGVDIRLNILVPEAWQETWKDQIRPFQLTERFDVVPLWQKSHYKKGRRIPIYIDTTLSFGTGLHETTQLMALLIEKCEGRFRSFLDVGTGTGILSVIAHYCGAGGIDFIDINEDCIMTAKNNMKHNHIVHYQASVCPVEMFSPRQQYDLLAANLTSKDLVRCSSKIVGLARQGGYMALSGIALENLAEVKGSFKRFSVRCVRILKAESWGALLFRKI